MYTFDDRFLDQVGLSGMPESQKQSFLQFAQDQFEIMIGEKMTANMDKDQMAEFERIIDGDSEIIQKELGAMGDYRQDEVFLDLLENSGEAAETPEIVNDFVTIKWLDKNCPNYGQIVEDSLKELQSKVISQKEVILAQ